MKNQLLIPLFLTVVATLGGCRASTLPVTRSALGTPRQPADLLAVIDLPGPLTVDTVVSAYWEVDLDGLLDLSDPKAKAAGLTNRGEPIEVDFHAIRHPQLGLFVVDTGVERAERDDPEHVHVRGLVRKVMNGDKSRMVDPFGAWLGRQSDRLQGVMLTHMHLDHVCGMPDVPAHTPVYTGPGEATGKQLDHLFTQGLTDDLMAGQDQVSEWPFVAAADGGLAVVDVFGDGSLWALATPGHTPGSTAYLARTPSGPILLTGDTCHTAWGWQNGVPPGSFTADRDANRRSLNALRELAARHPKMQVRLGHQRLVP